MDEKLLDKNMRYSIANVVQDKYGIFNNETLSKLAIDIGI